MYTIHFICIKIFTYINFNLMFTTVIQELSWNLKALSFLILNGAQLSYVCVNTVNVCR